MSSGSFWDHFDDSKIKQNQSHNKTYCNGCLDHQKKLLQDSGTYDDVDWKAKGESFLNGASRKRNVKRAPYMPEQLASESGPPGVSKSRGSPTFSGNARRRAADMPATQR